MKKVNCGYCKKEIERYSQECPHCGKKFLVFEKKGEKLSLLKNIFLKILIVSLSFCALMGILIFLFGDSAGIKENIVITLFAVGGFNFTALCASIWYEKKKFFPISFSGIIVSIAGMLYSLLLIWEIVDTHSNGFAIKLLFIFIITSLALAYSSLLLLGYKKENLLIRNIVLITIGQVFLISLIGIGLIIGKWEVEPPFFKVLSVMGILIVLGTVITPLLNKVYLSDKNP